MVQFTFNSQQFDPSYGGGKSLPVGKKYKGAIVESYFETTKNGQGQMLVFTNRVLEGPLAGQECIDRLNLHNTSSLAVEIANKQLSAYCHAIGVYQFQQTEQLHNIPFCFDIGWQKGQEPSQEKPEGGYTQITAIYDAQGNAPGKARQAPAQAPAAPAIPQAPPGGVTPVSQPQWAQPGQQALQALPGGVTPISQPQWPSGPSTPPPGWAGR